MGASETPADRTRLDSDDRTRFDPDDLVRHGKFVKALARELAHGDDEADELAAKTMAIAVERQPDTGPGLRAWLRGVLRRLLWRERRDVRRRGRRELSAARALEGSLAAPATVDLAARVELERNVAAAFAALDEPYRSTLFLRYFDDLPPKSIAARTHVPVDTVKTRLKRGLARLRATLDARHDQRREEWRGIAIALAAGSPAATISTPLKIASAAAALLFLGVAVREVVVGSPRTMMRPDETSTHGIVAPATSDRARLQVSGDMQAVREPEVRLPFASGVVRDTSGEPLGGVEVIAGTVYAAERRREGILYSRRALEPGSPSRPRLATTGVDGRFVVEQAPGDLASLYFMKPGYAAAEWFDLSADRSENQDHEVVLANGRRLRGRVTDTSGRPITFAAVSVHGPSSKSEQRVARAALGSPAYWAMVGWVEQKASVDADGAFELATLPETFVLAVHALGYRSHRTDAALTKEELQVELLRESLVVDVVDARTREPLASARALIARVDDPAFRFHLLPWWTERRTYRPADLVPMGRLLLWQKSQFDFLLRDDSGMPDRRDSCQARLHLLADGHRSRVVEVALSGLEEPPHLLLELDSGEDEVAIAGTIIGADSSRVDLRWLPPGLRSSSTQNQIPLATVRTGPDGAFRFRGLPPETYRLYVEADGRTPRWLDVDAPIAGLDVELAESCTLEVLAINREGLPQPGVTIHVQSADHVRAWSRITDAQGRAVLESLPDGSLFVAAVPGLYYSSDREATNILREDDLDPVDRVELVPGERRRIERRIIERRPVTLRVHGEDGATLTGARVMFEELRSGHFPRDADKDEWARLRELTLVTDANGEVFLDAFPATYSFRVVAGRGAVQRVVVIPRDGDARIEITVPEDRGVGVIRGRVTELGRDVPVVGRLVHAGARLPDGSNGAEVTTTTDVDGIFELRDVPAAVVTVHVVGRALADGTDDASSPYGNASRTVYLVADDELTLRFELACDGELPPGHPTCEIDVKIVDDQSGAPIAGCELELHGSKSGMDLEVSRVRTDREGRARGRVYALPSYAATLRGPYRFRGESRISPVYEPAVVSIVPVDGIARVTLRLKRRS